MKRSSGLTDEHYDNILLTEREKRLIDEGMSALKNQVGDIIFEKYRELELNELEEFKEYFLNRMNSCY